MIVIARQVMINTRPGLGASFPRVLVSRSNSSSREFLVGTKVAKGRRNLRLAAFQKIDYQI
jgi:hypothetical protein